MTCLSSSWCLDEGVEEFVVERLVPGLAGEHCAEVRASLTHDLLEAVHGGALGCHCHVLGGSRETDDVRPVVGEHRMVPRDAQLQLNDRPRKTLNWDTPKQRLELLLRA